MSGISWKRPLAPFVLIFGIISFSPSLLYTQQDPKLPPDPLMVNDKNCIIKQHGKTWAATCTASYLNHANYHREPWTVQLPERKSEPAANKDVMKWFAAIAKIQAAAKPVNVHDLKKEKQ